MTPGLAGARGRVLGNQLGLGGQQGHGRGAPAWTPEMQLPVRTLSALSAEQSCGRKIGF